jgi:hypothetical protein
MRAPLLAGLVLLTTHAAASAIAAQPVRGRVTLPGFRETIILDTLAVSFEVNAPPSRTYAATVAILEGMKVPLEVRDSLGGLVGNLRLTMMRRLAGEPLSRFFNCGNTMTGPSADMYRVHSALLAILDPLPDNKTRLRIAFAAGARDVSGPSTEPVTCGSSGIFEVRLADRIKALLGSSPGSPPHPPASSPAKGG